MSTMAAAAAAQQEGHFKLLLDEYNLLITSCKEKYNVKFTICKKSILTTCQIEHLQQHLSFFNHKYLTTCYYQNLNYCACVEFYNDKNEQVLHECNIFPIILGSDLDLQFLHFSTQEHGNSDNLCNCIQTQFEQIKPNVNYKCNLFVNQQYYDPKYYSNLFGYVIIGGKVSIIPYLITNNRELFHCISDKTVLDRSKIKKKKQNNFKLFNNIYVEKAATTPAVIDSAYFFKTKKNIYKYIYTDDSRGILLKFFGDNLLFRDFLGKNFLNTFPTHHLNNFNEMFNYNRHIDWTIASFKRAQHLIKKHILPIDNLSNKLILSPAILLYRLFFLIIKKPIVAHQIVYLGTWSKLLSFTAQSVYLNTFTNKSSYYNNISKNHVKNLDVNTSNLYRNVSSSQICRRDCFSQVLRPSPHNISTNIIPEKYNGFLCLLERGINIDSFNKHYTLISDVAIYTFTMQKKKNYMLLTECLDYLLEKNFLIQSSSNGDGVLILINGGLPTKYCKHPDITFDFFFYTVKQLNPCIEVIYHNSQKYILLNHFQGVPFKEQCYTNEQQQQFALSPQELHESAISKYFTINTFFGNAQINKLSENIENFKINKLLFGVNYMKNKIESIHYAPYSIFTRENTMFFHENYGDDNDTLKVNTCFVAEPFCTQDGFILNSKQIKVLFIRRYTLDLYFTQNMKLLLNNNNNNTQQHGNFNKTMNNFYIGEIQTFNNNLDLYNDNLKILKTPKITIQTFNMGNNCYSHQLYIDFNDKCIIEGDYFYATVQTYLYVGNNMKKKISINNVAANKYPLKLSIEVLFQHVNDKYDGLKLCNYSCQKGIANVDLSIDEKLPQLAKQNVEVVASVFSILGRSPITQINEMSENCQSTAAAAAAAPLIGKTSMEILKNVSSDHKNMASLRFDNLTINVVQVNDCYRATYCELQKAIQNEKEQKQFLPKLHREKTQLFLTTGKNIEFKSLADNTTYNLLKL